MINLSALVYTLNHQSSTPLFVQLSNEIRQRIVLGEIEQNQQLPPSRSLALELALSRSTITNAYEQLVAEGYIEGRRGSGFYTCPIGQIDLKPDKNNSDVTKTQFSVQPELRRQNNPSSPDVRLFPYRQWAQCISRVARLNPQALISSDDPFGNIGLRQSIARFLREWRGLEAHPGQILITAGSIDALEVCVRTLAKSGAYIGLENPGYQPLRNIVLNLGMKPFWLSMREREVEVPDINSTKQAPSMTVLTPSHHFPLGGAMSPLRRREFLKWAEETGSWIIEDDYDSEFRYAGSPIQALAGFDTSNRTIYIGTFSKVLSVGLRLGFLVSPPDLISRFSGTLSKFGIKAATTSQQALSEFMDRGEFYRHIRRSRRIYGERRKLMLNLLQEKLGDVLTVEDHAAGMQLMAALPEASDDEKIVERARDKGLILNSLSSHYAQGKIRKGLVLGFCGFNEIEIRDNIDILNKIIRSSN